MSRFDEHVEKYKPYLNEFDFTGTEAYRLLEHQRVNPNIEVINKRIAEAKKIITSDIINSKYNEKSRCVIGKKTYRGYVKPDLMRTLFLYIEYSKLITVKTETKNPYPQIFAGNNNIKHQLFKHIYNELDLKPKSKASTLYRYFKEQDYFTKTISEKKYLEWLKENNYPNPAKIMPINFKQGDVLKEQIPQIEKDFLKRTK